MAEQKGPPIDLKDLEKALNDVMDRLRAIPESGLTDRETKYKALKIKQLEALKQLTKTAMCPETWGVWPPEP